MPVSITATPTPSPFATAQLWGASTEKGYAVCRREGSIPFDGGRTDLKVEKVRALTLTRAIRPSRARRACALGDRRTARPRMIWERVGDLSIGGADDRLALGERDAVAQLDDVRRVAGGRLCRRGEKDGGREDRWQEACEHSVRGGSSRLREPEKLDRS